MSLRLAVASVFLGLNAALAGSPPGDGLPAAPPANRYDAMAARSPFSPPSVAPVVQAPPPPPPGPAWSDSLSVKGLIQSGNIYVATVEDANGAQRHFAVRSDKEDEESHLTLAGVRWDSASSQPTVTVRRGATEFAQLRYEPSVSGSAPSAAPLNPGPNRALPGFGVPPQPPGGFHPPPAANSVVNPAVNAARSGAIVTRRPIIQASPAPPPVRPGAAQSPLQPNRGAVTTATAPGDDDDDE